MQTKRQCIGRMQRASMEDKIGIINYTLLAMNWKSLNRNKKIFAFTLDSLCGTGMGSVAAIRIVKGLIKGVLWT